ncbi:response regulator [Flavobacterium sp. CYK-4]|uniref:response regulator n=1 Tax=Flavobacterium lotistagni TaxID=2709660 RepID=UPI001407CF38|nr:response regulator [Flavobacterium lotistagni]NHM07958.1 response regulator [Flavobacterium lotistagni]
MKKYILISFFFCAGFALAQNEKANIENQINTAGKYFNKGQYEKALELSKSALVRSFKINDDYLIAHSYNAIGVIYDEFSQSKHAISFYKKALAYASKTENDSLNDWIYSNLGSVYYFSKIDVEKGIQFYKKSLKFATKINDSVQITYTKLNIASAYFSVNDFKNGINYVRQSQDYVKRKGTHEMQFTLASLLGIYHTHDNQPEMAMQYYNSAIAIADKYQFQSYLLNIYETLVTHYKYYRQPELAQEYQEKFNLLNKTLYSQDKKDLLKESAMQIELDEYRIQLERIELENEKQFQKLQESNRVTALFSVLLVVFLVLLLTLYRSNKFRKKINAELSQANTELQLAKEQAEEASKMKSQFVSTITHELRTPLYGVVGITDIITDEHKELANSPHLNSLKFSARYLLSLVNDILQLNKMDEKHIVLETAVFSMQEELDAIVNSVQYIADNNANELIVAIDPKIPTFLIGDRLRLSQILMNLTSNALKFTRNGKVKISMLHTGIQNDTHQIEFKVSDTGVGIAPADQQKIFEMFVQVGRTDEDYQGTGLGLSIVKKLIALFGSSIHLESELKKGTTFRFTIGFKAAQDVQNLTMATEKVLQTPSSLKVLVVEDNKINQLVTQKIMDKHQIKCDMVEDGFSALHLLETNQYDVILMDINMPIMNGFDTTRRIRNLGIQTPVIALTAFDKEEVKEQAMACGMNDIIIKPFEPEKLFEMIYQLVGESQ